MTVTVYVKPSCVQCTATYRALDAEGIEYDVFDISLEPDKLEIFKTLGYTQAPAVVTDIEHWSGFRPDEIDDLVARLRRQGLLNADKALASA